MAAIDFQVSLEVRENGRRAPQYTIENDLEGQVSFADFVDYSRRLLISIALDVLKEEQARGFDKYPVFATDGRVGKPVTSVNPFGSIEFTARSDMKEIINATYSALLSRSPVDTGQYLGSHLVLLNGTVVATNEIALAGWLRSNPVFQQKDIIRFINLAPYARKLERLGITRDRRATRTRKSTDSQNRSGFGGRVLAPNGTYYLTARSIKRKFKRNTSIRFGFTPGSQIQGAGKYKDIAEKTFKTTTERSGGKTRTVRRKKPGSAYLYPTITLYVNEGTL